MRVAAEVIRIALALALAALAASLFPDPWGPPFAGCPTNPFLTLQAGCSEWPAVFTGFAFVGVFASIAPNRFRYFGMAPVAVVTISGGLDLLHNGSIMGRWPLADWPFLFVSGLPIFSGGAIAIALHAFAASVAGNRQFTPRRADAETIGIAESRGPTEKQLAKLRYYLIICWVGVCCGLALLVLGVNEPPFGYRPWVVAAALLLFLPFSIVTLTILWQMIETWRWWLLLIFVTWGWALGYWLTWLAPLAFLIFVTFRILQLTQEFKGREGPPNKQLCFRISSLWLPIELAW